MTLREFNTFFVLTNFERATSWQKAADPHLATAAVGQAKQAILQAAGAVIIRQVARANKASSSCAVNDAASEWVLRRFFMAQNYAHRNQSKRCSVFGTLDYFDRWKI